MDTKDWADLFKMISEAERRDAAVIEKCDLSPVSSETSRKQASYERVGLYVFAAAITSS